MTTPTGFVNARRLAGVVKVADRYLPEGFEPRVIPGGVVGPGDIAVLPEGEAAGSDYWEIVVAEEPTPKTKTGGNG